MAKRETYTTPVGVFQYPKLTKPDTGFNNTAGKYKVHVIFPSDSKPVQELMAIISAKEDEHYKAMLAEARAKKKKPLERGNLPFEPVIDLETGEETGYILFKFNMNASGIDPDTGKRWERRPIIFDAHRAEINIDKTKLNIWSGTEGKVNFSLFPYTSQKAGISLKLNAVQIIKLVSGSQDYGFEEEDGYTLTETEGYEEEEVSTTAADTEAPDDNEDF